MSNIQVTVFKNIKDTDTPFYVSVDTVFERIKNGAASKDLIIAIRKEKVKKERNEMKKALPSICFSGLFTKRADNAITQHSGLICLDFDGYDKKKDLLEHKEILTRDRFVYSVFISPSGNGLKVLVKIPADVDNHVNYFNALQDHFNSDKFDPTSKNVGRVCYESYDPLIYVNENSSVWDVINEIEYEQKEVHRDPVTIKITDENKIVDILLKWWQKKYPMIEGQRNHNCYVLAAAFNDFGINQSLATYVLNNYATTDFNEAEIKRTIDSAYSNTNKFGCKYYEDEERINSIKAKIKRGVPKKEVKQQLLESNIEEEVAEAVLKRVDEESKDAKFWRKSDKGVVSMVHIEFKRFLEDNGFYKYCPEGSKNYIFVRVTNNLIDHADENEIKDFVLNYLLELDDTDVYNFFADKTRFFKEEFLTLLSTIDIYFVEDTKNTSYLYYLNCAVRITKNEVVKIDYVDLGGYVWKDHVIDRSFNICEITEKCDYAKFIYNISGKNEERVKSIESTIGFLLHGHKNQSYCPAVILNDEVVSDNPEGGTGKGIFMNALGHMKKVVTIDGKLFNFEKSFAYQLVSADTQILVFDDVKKYFEFERLFSAVTEGLTLEKKNKDAIKIPFHKSPKITLTTNYAIRGSGNSFERRKWELEFHQYYNKNFTPLNEFGRLLFGDWNDNDWCQFDNYMIYCLQYYMEHGLVKSKFVNLKLRQLISDTSHDFVEWAGLLDNDTHSNKLLVNQQYSTNELYHDFIDEYPDYGPKSKLTISRTKFNQYLKFLGVYMTNGDPEMGRSSSGKWIRLKTQAEIITQQKLNV